MCSRVARACVSIDLVSLRPPQLILALSVRQILFVSLDPVKEEKKYDGASPPPPPPPLRSCPSPRPSHAGCRAQTPRRRRLRVSDRLSSFSPLAAAPADAAAGSLAVAASVRPRSAPAPAPAATTALLPERGCGCGVAPRLTSGGIALQPLAMSWFPEWATLLRMAEGGREGLEVVYVLLPACACSVVATVGEKVSLPLPSLCFPQSYFPLHHFLQTFALLLYLFVIHIQYIQQEIPK